MRPSDFSPPLNALLALQRSFERGPKREGAFAVWLVVRVALEQGLNDRMERADEHRLASVKQRIATLAGPSTLSRALRAALAHLEQRSAAGARIALSQLVAPARDALGADAAEAIALAARTIHERQLLRPEGPSASPSPASPSASPSPRRSRPATRSRSD